MVLMLILQTAKELGLPELMDGSRCRIYFGYMLPVAFAFAADGVIRLLLWKKNWRKGRNFCSLVCVAASVCLLWNGDYRKESVENPGGKGFYLDDLFCQRRDADGTGSWLSL